MDVRGHSPKGKHFFKKARINIYFATVTSHVIYLESKYMERIYHHQEKMILKDF